MPRLSSPIADIKPDYDVVVVGSGYGGAIAASRLSRAIKDGQPLSVCVLERGREFQPGEYPDTAGKMLGEVQITTTGLHLFSPTGLYDFRINDELNVLVGCGLGGGSLINANVVLFADYKVFARPWWPRGLVDDIEGLRLGRERAECMLNPSSYPDDRHPLKLQALKKSAKLLEESVSRSPIAVTFKDGVNRVGVQQYACADCGDCVSGCNYAAKNSLIMNYLPDAKAHGAEMYTEVSVLRVEPIGERWIVHYELLDSGRQRFGPPAMTVTARWLVLAAGTLGTTEILLRSQRADAATGAPGLSLSPMVGTGFSSNGDVLAVSYNGEDPVEGIGFGRHQSLGREPVGPTITGTIDLRGRERKLEDQMVIQEGAIPGAIAPFLSVILAFANVLVGLWQPAARRQAVKIQLRRWFRCLRGAYRGAVRSTQTLLVMAHDSAAGVMRLGPNDRLRVEWPQTAGQPVYDKIDKTLRKVSAPLKGAYVRNPVNQFLVHPLGGCRMADSAELGVVNHEGAVFKGQTGTEVYPRLYVADGSVIPRSLGVNPLLTISALAERMCARLAVTHGLDINYSFRCAPSAPLARPGEFWLSERRRLGLEFSERMTGYFADAIARKPTRAEWQDQSMFFKAACQTAAKRGEAKGQPFQATLTVISDDLEGMLIEPNHKARLVGTVFARELSDRPMTISNGYFQFFEVDPERVETRRMVYGMTVTGDTGWAHDIWGFKEIRNSLPWKAWADLTTLYVRIVSKDPTGVAAPRIRLGIIRISWSDFIRQLTTIRARHVRRFTERFDVPFRFLTVFAKIVRNSYGRVLAESIIATPDAPIRKWTPRRNSVEQMPVPTSDGFVARLTHYRGDRARPVILTAGFSVAASSYATQTLEPKHNLVDYLLKSGYDVWLLDYRGSADIPPPATSFSIDDIARRDWPAAIKRVLEETKQDHVQIMAHCVSSLAIMMCLLDGRLENGMVSSLVCSQVAAHPIVPPQTEVKVGIHLTNLLRFFGVQNMRAKFDPRTWGDWAIDQLLKLYPTRERCNSPVCRRILFIFHESFHHGQLNRETHDSMWRWYGSANLRALKQLAIMIREGHVVDEEANDVYMPNVSNLKLPISLMSGELNRSFLPDSTLETYKWLRSHNGRHWYRRKVFRNYGHMDCFVGRNAPGDVYPWIVKQLREPPRPKEASGPSSRG